MSNPTLNENTFNNVDTIYVNRAEAMTLNGTIGKSAFLLIITFLGAAFAFVNGNAQLTQVLMIAGLILGFILALIISFKPTTAPMLAPIYAACEGLALGGLSMSFEAAYPGIVFQAILGTFATMFTMLALFLGRIIEVNNKFRAIVLSATIAVFASYLISFVLSLFGIAIPIPTPVLIGLNVVVIIIAALNLLNDFDIIERGVNSFAPKYFEWYCSFGLLVTLVWLYIEFLKLLSRLNRR